MRQGGVTYLSQAVYTLCASVWCILCVCGPLRVCICGCVGEEKDGEGRGLKKRKVGEREI